MQKLMMTLALLATAVAGNAAGEREQRAAEADTLKRVDLQEVQVTAVRATKKTPIAFSNVGRE